MFTKMRFPAILIFLCTSAANALEDQRAHHWSVQPVPPQQTGKTIDDFITAGLTAQHLQMSEQADPRTLIRRLTFDLTGLPPSPEEVEAFVTPDRPNVAYEDLVDRLLASPHYGERWARHWLDIAHYADTHGFERDQLRPNAWRYRDYVIESLNADKPYDQFLREQIAGDVIAPHDPQAVIATGFLAAGPWDFVGHVETQSPALNRAARAGDLDDMVTQVITSTMGITINCARCHDHKLDPISQQEYYQLRAVFAGVKRDNREVSAEESARLREEKARLQTQSAKARAEIARLTGEDLDLADMVGGGDGRGTGNKGSGLVLASGATTMGKLAFQENIPPNKLLAPKFSPDSKPFIKGIFLPQGGAESVLEIAPGIQLKDFPSTSLQSWDAVRDGPLNAQVHAKANDVDFLSEGHSVLGLHANAGIVFDLAAIRQFHHLGKIQLQATVAFGAGEAAGDTRADIAIYVDGMRVLHRDKLRKSDSVPVDLSIPETAAFLTFVATDGGDGIGHDLLYLGDARLKPAEADATLTPADAARLDQLKMELQQLQKDIDAVPEPPQVYAVVSQDTPPVIRVQRRGNPEDEAQEVVPGGIAWSSHAAAAFGDNATPGGQRRRALAEWITHPANPLTTRVLVNRLWHHHFGQGLVTTPSDFGLGGDKPSHPELLDWLAAEFLKSGWSLKHMHKLIVMSAAYRQQSTTPISATNHDSGNRLLWRQNARRLDAESLHDAVLSVAGTLNPTMGGPGYRDFNYTEAYAPIYEYITPETPNLLRRSIYRFIVRTTPHEFMSTMDCPDPANFTPARAHTTTALQALALSNNELMLQQADAFAKSIQRETNSPEAAVRRAFARALLRAPSPDELAAGLQLASQQGLMVLCRMLINANEFVYLD